MTRIRRVLTLFGPALSLLFWVVPTVRGADAEVGVEATYSLVFSLPFMDQNGTMVVTYLVTGDELCTHVDWDVGFINGAMRPGPTGVTFHDDGHDCEFSSPFIERKVVDEKTRVVPATYDSQAYAFWHLASAHHEAKIWQAANSDLAQVSIREKQSSFSSDVLSERKLFHCAGDMTFEKDRLTSLSVNAAPGWRRTYMGIGTVGNGESARLAAADCIIQVPNGQLKSFNQGPVDGRFPGMHDRYSDVGLVYHRGARHIRTLWVPQKGVVVPRQIRVTLGTTGQGMLLRDARLISSRVLPADQIRQRMTHLRTQTRRDEAPLGANRFISEYFWPKSPQQKTAKAMEIETRLRQEISIRQADSALTVGDAIGFANTMVYLDALTDTSSNLSVTKNDLSKLSGLLGKHAGAESQVAAVFNFLEMTRFLKRRDLETLGVDRLKKILSALSPEQHLGVLFSVSGATETQDIRLLELVSATQRCLGSTNVPEFRIRGALSVIEQRILSFSSTGLYAGRGEPDPQHVSAVREELHVQLNRLLDQLHLNRSPDLHSAADRIGLLLPCLHENLNERR